jgi:hypothetical protein
VADEQKNVILICWDGYQRNHLLEDLSNGYLHNLEELMDMGVFLNLTVIDHYSQTKPGHAQMMTGYRGDIHGVFANKVNFTSVPSGFTFIERMEEHFGDDKITTGFIAGKHDHIYPVFKNLENVDFISIEEVDPAINGPKIVEFIDENAESRFFAFFHFSKPDKSGHKYNENSVEYSLGGQESDYWLGKIIDKLMEKRILNNTLIYVTTDHGFMEGMKGHKNDPDIWLISNDIRLQVNEFHNDLDMIDIAPTIMYSLGINYTSYDPPLPGYPLQEKHPNSSPAHSAIHDKAMAIEITIQPIIDENNQVKVKAWYSTRAHDCVLWEVSENDARKSELTSFISNFKTWDIEDSVDLYFLDSRENMAKITLYPPQIEVVEEPEYQKFYPIIFLIGGICIGFLITRSTRVTLIP